MDAKPDLRLKSNPEVVPDAPEAPEVVIAQSKGIRADTIGGSVPLDLLATLVCMLEGALQRLKDVI